MSAGDMPAFPVNGRNRGMTLRDYFAAQALVGVIARMPKKDYDSSVDSEDWSFATGDAYRIADSMIYTRDAEYPND